MISAPLNIIGNLSLRGGLGVHARHMVRLAVDFASSVAAFDTSPQDANSTSDNEFADLTVTDPSKLQNGVNLYLLQPRSLFSFCAQYHYHLFQPGMLNIALPMWELPVLPPRWRRGFSAFDALLCGSRYLEGIYQLHVPGVVTIPAPCPIQLPDLNRPSRSEFGIPDGKVLYVAAFDPSSDLERKNPLGVVDAYLKAFPNETGARLILKAHGLNKRPETTDFLSRLRARIGLRHDIQLLDASLSYADTLRLFACADVFVSLHRAEGLGLPLLEAMLLGVPVIATAWSGNMSFMDARNSCLVDYHFISVKANLPVYQPAFLTTPAYWAEPDLKTAANWMVRLYESSALRTELGIAGKISAQQYVTHARETGYFDQIQAIARLQNPVRTHLTGISARELWEAAGNREVGPLKFVAKSILAEVNRYGWHKRR